MDEPLDALAALDAEEQQATSALTERQQSFTTPRRKKTRDDIDDDDAADECATPNYASPARPSASSGEGPEVFCVGCGRSKQFGFCFWTIGAALAWGATQVAEVFGARTARIVGALSGHTRAAKHFSLSGFARSKISPNGFGLCSLSCH